jgi:hypothetical protein
MHVLWIAACFAAQSSTLAWAEEPVGCDKFKWPDGRPAHPQFEGSQLRREGVDAPVRGDDSVGPIELREPPKGA